MKDEGTFSITPDLSPNTSFNDDVQQPKGGS